MLNLKVYNINNLKTFKKYPAVYILKVLCTDIDTLGWYFYNIYNKCGNLDGKSFLWIL